MKNCLSCHAESVETLLDFGVQPPSNRFLPTGESVVDRYPLILGQCRDCGFYQLMDPMPVEMVRPRHNWLVYNEPEGHLDDLVARLTRSIEGDSVIFGLTYKDKSTLERFNQRGFFETVCFDPSTDLGIDDPCAGLETIQERVTDEMAERLIRKYGQADLLIARHVLEHSHKPDRFLESLRKLLRPGGSIVLEVPDSRKLIEARDYSFIWEEHISYFTPRTLVEMAGHNGFSFPEIMIYPYAFEDSIIAVLNSGVSQQKPEKVTGRAADLENGRRFSEGFDATRNHYRIYLEAFRRKGKRTALFGAGHLAVRFLNYFGLSNLVDVVIDDHPRKRGLAMPGSGLAIVDSSHLEDVDLCLLSLSPESEAKVMAKQQGFIQKGGVFASIFASSPMALQVEPC